MRSRARSVVFVLTLVTGLLVALGLPAGADHTTPPGPLSSTTETTQVGTQLGAGTWTHITNFPPNPGTDLALFNKRVGATTEIYASSGTLGGGPAQHVGQRITRLTSNNGATVDPTWIADHGSSADQPFNSCGITSTGSTGLQHDAAAVGTFRRITRPTTQPGPLNVQLIADTTDASGRCHDTGGGGLELIDVTNITQPREIHLTRHAGTSHTVTTDALRPWILYNSSSTFGSMPWIDVLDVRTCLDLGAMTLAQKRAACRPKVFRIPFQPEWTFQRNFATGGGAIDPSQGSSSCHDITAIGTRLYCAALAASLILDVSNLTDAAGNIRGTQMVCPVIAGTNTAAMVTNCAGQGATAPTVDPTAFEFLGTINHAGRDCTAPVRSNTCNSNNFAPSAEDVSVAHEADPSHDARVMFVTDERGGGVVPPGATCFPVTNPFGNGGMHAIDIRDAAPNRPAVPNFPHWRKPDGSKAVFIGTPITPSATFCDIHMIEHAPQEQRIFAAWYTQGVKVVDYFFQDNGPGPADDRLSFRETSAFQLPGANTWMANPFKIVDNPNGTRTYFLVAGDIDRGLDVYSYTNTPNPIGAPPPPAQATATIQAGSVGWGLLVLLAVLPAAAMLRRRRRSRA